MRVVAECLLILGPEPGGDSFFDIGERLLFIFTLRNASRQGGAFGGEPTILSLHKSDVENHNRIQLSSTVTMEAMRNPLFFAEGEESIDAGGADYGNP